MTATHGELQILPAYAGILAGLSNSMGTLFHTTDRMASKGMHANAYDCDITH